MGSVWWCRKREYVNMKSSRERIRLFRTAVAEINGGTERRMREIPNSLEDSPFVLRPGLDVNFATSTIFTANVCPVCLWMHFLTTLNGPLKWNIIYGLNTCKLTITGIFLNRKFLFWICCFSLFQT